jgi:hypothetical protein
MRPAAMAAASQPTAVGRTNSSPPREASVGAA